MTEAGFEAMQKMRMEKDLQELQSLIEKHFEQRKADDQDLEGLRQRIEVRKETRAEAMRVRQQREKERLEREKQERARREEEEVQRKKEEEERKKEAIASMSNAGKGAGDRDRRAGNRRQTEKEKKRKALAERRKPLNIDHLATDKIRDKIQEMYAYLFELEGIKYDYEGDVLDRQKYELVQRRERMQRYNDKLLTRKQKMRQKGQKVSLLK